MNVAGLNWWEVNIASGNGLVPLGISWAGVDPDMCVAQPLCPSTRCYTCQSAAPPPCQSTAQATGQSAAYQSWHRAYQHHQNRRQQSTMETHWQYNAEQTKQHGNHGKKWKWKEKEKNKEKQRNHSCSNQRQRPKGKNKKPTITTPSRESRHSPHHRNKNENRRPNINQRIQMGREK